MGMFDAGSDVIDWLAAIPWTGVGIGGSIVAALAASAHFGRVMLIAWKRGRIREKLGEYLSEGQALSNRCANEKEPAPETEAEDWNERTETYLAEHLGNDYVASYSNAAGLPMGTTSITSKDHRDLNSGIRVRLARLQQFLEELRR